MRQKLKHSVTEHVRAQVWVRRESGMSTVDIARSLGAGLFSVRSIIHRCGGIRPPERCRSQRSLSVSEREEISRGLMAGCSMREIARHLKRAPSSISREIGRHGGIWCYRALTADERAWRLACRPKVSLLARNESLCQLVTHKLLIDWSPQQISGWLKQAYSNDATMQISHETIYRSLFVQPRGALKKELTAHLRTGRSMRRNRKSTSKVAANRIADIICIRDRPPQVEDRAIPGHWEGDLLCGDTQSQIATLVERKSRFVMLVKTPTKSSHQVVAALSKHVRKLPAQLRGSLTWDRGFELKCHKDFTLATKMKVYFCDPHSPWQRGSNENTNGLLRQYFPKGQNLSNVTQRQLDFVASRLNQRPRKTLGYSTPAQMFAKSVALTG